MSLGYRYALDGTCCEVFNGLSRRQRDRLLASFRRLADAPFTAGDYRETDQRGLPLEVGLVEDDFLVTWHVDHAAKEVRVIGLELV
jgi:hypothetical protein